MADDIAQTDPGFNPNQHCTYPNQDGVDDYSFSHTAAFCGQPQPRRCGCPFDYPKSPAPRGKATNAEALRRQLAGLEDDVLIVLEGDTLYKVEHGVTTELDLDWVE